MKAREEFHFLLKAQNVVVYSLFFWCGVLRNNRMIRCVWFESGQHSMRSSCDPVLRLCYVCSLFRGQFCFEFISSKAPWDNIVFPFVSWPCATHTLYNPHSSNRCFPCRSTSAFWTRCTWTGNPLVIKSAVGLCNMKKMIFDIYFKYCIFLGWLN